MDEIKSMPVMGPMKQRCPYENLELETVANGYCVEYYERMPTRSEYEHAELSKKEFVFGVKEFNKAVAKYKEISDCIMEYMNK